MVNRNTTIRDRHRRHIARGRPPCHLCGQPINYDAGHLAPDSYTVDHVMPLAKGGTDTLDNKAAAHRACNRAKSDALPGIQHETTRTW